MEELCFFWTAAGSREWCPRTILLSQSNVFYFTPGKVRLERKQLHLLLKWALPQHFLFPVFSRDMGRHKQRSMKFPRNFPSITYSGISINYKASFSFWAGEPDKEDLSSSRSLPETAGSYSIGSSCQGLEAGACCHPEDSRCCIPAVLLPAGRTSSSRGILSLQSTGGAEV